MRWLPLLFLTATACAKDDETFDNRTISISSRASLGSPLAVRAAGSQSRGKPCSLESGEFGPWVDCNEFRNLDAKLLSVECIPAEACADITLDGPKGTVVPLLEHFELHAVGDVEGVRVERTESIEAGLPGFQFPSEGTDFDGNPIITFEGSPLQLCLSAQPAVRYVVKQSGIELPLDLGDSAENCVQLSDPSPGPLTVEAHLVRPDRILATKVKTIAALADVQVLDVLDFYCPYGTGLSYVEAHGKYYVGFTAYGTTDAGRGPLPVTTAHVEGGTAAATGTGTNMIFVFDAPPPSTAEIVVEAGPKTLRLPLHPYGASCH